MMNSPKYLKKSYCRISKYLGLQTTREITEQSNQKLNRISV